MVCLSATLYQTFSPLTALALTTGPQSPDATSFEPTDTSTMVNPVTGDFVYNVPLMEVPGPEGSYPLSLSYHAGINPEQESSWVGLGWTLNPGSVTRSVNGFPDDWANIQGSRRDYWEGGVTNTTSVGVNIPVINVSADVTVIKDTYLGVGVGWNVAYSFGIGKKGSGIMASIGVGSNPYSDGFSVTGGLSAGSVGLTASLGENASVGISASVFNILGATLSTNGASASFSLPIESQLSNSKEGLIQTETSKNGLNLILFNYSNTRTRYWSDETESSSIYGALNSKSFSGLLTNNSLINDIYQLPNENSVFFTNPEKFQGGAFPAFDNYEVTGQGIGGVVRPYLYQGSLSKQNVFEREGTNPAKMTVQYANNSKVSNNLGFRFVGDFSNTLQQANNAFATNATTITTGSLPFTAPFGADANWGGGYNATNQVLTGSKSIQYFKVDANGNVIVPNSNVKFIHPVALGLDRKKHLGALAAGTTSNGITGFAITNESGVTYHYNLPAYSYEEESYQENRGKANGLKFNRQTKSSGYAYIWHLTAVTGPDYVDRGTIGVLDDADYGYWVSFEYGKWSDEFIWRNPADGFMINFDQNFQTIALGKKEVYYLNAIKTRTHTALFEKESRNDGKSASKESFNKNWSSQNNVSTDYNNTGIYNINSNQSLRLSHVYILKNNAAVGLNEGIGGTAGMIPAGRTVDCSQCELPNNTLDKNDVNAYGRSQLESNSLRVIDLNYDYSLAKGTVTSFDFSNPSTKLGKLTLKSLKTRGKGGANILPAVEFGYNLLPEEQGKAQGTVTTGSITGVAVGYQIGDLIETDEVNPIYCGYIDRITQSNGTFSYELKGGASITNPGLKNIRKTKNPPYKKDFYDFWGMFKSDYEFNFEPNFARMPTKRSIRSVDVWSLRTIKTTTGATVNIDYEGHDFEKASYGVNRPFWFEYLSKVSTGIYRLSNTNIKDCYDYCSVGDEIRGHMVRSSEKKDPIYSSFTPVTDVMANFILEVAAVGSNYIDVRMNPSTEQWFFHIGDANYRNTSMLGYNLPAVQPKYNTVGGSGVRVKSIKLKTLDGVKMSTNYNYKQENNITSSGITIYEPLGFEPFRYAHLFSAADKDYYDAMFNEGLFASTKFTSELPGPSVMYARVETSTETIYPDATLSPSAGKSVMEFMTFADLKIDKSTLNRDINSGVSTRNYVLRKFMSLLGSPKGIVNYDGNGKLTKRVVNQYLHEGITGDFFEEYKTRLQKFGYQGLITERFSEAKKVLNADNTWQTLGTMTAREDYPLVNIGTVEYDYIHNTKTSTKVNAFDFYSGAVTESITTDSYGNSFLSQSTPAYRDFAAMGPSQLDGTKKNMLTQVSASNVYRLNASGVKEHLVSASYNVWSNGGSVLDGSGNAIVQNSAATNGDVWRQTSGYVWMPSSVAANGMTAVASFVAFPGSNPAGANAAWKRNSDVVLMDTYSHVLSMRDFKNNYVSTRYGYNNAKPVLSGTFAKYGEIAFSGAEDENISNAKKFEVGKGTGTVSAAAFHTGSKSIQLAAGQTGFDYSVAVSELTAARTYTASVWVNNQAAHNVKLYYQLDGVQKTVSAASTVSTKTSGNWTLVTFDITLSGGTTVRVFAKNDGTGTSYVDDFRFHPKNSVSLASVYDAATGELTYSLDRNNLYTRYEYNAMGQLVATYREQFGRTPYKVSETQLNYSTRSFNGLSN